MIDQDGMQNQIVAISKVYLLIIMAHVNYNQIL
jgi:hypothetical protein